MKATTKRMGRRDFIVSGAAALTGGALLLGRSGESRAATEVHVEQPRDRPGTDSPGVPGDDYTQVVVPGGAKLEWKVVNGAKVYHLIAEEVDHEFAPGLKAKCWGYNGSVNGPVIEAVE